MKKALLTTILLCAMAMAAAAQEMPWFWHRDKCPLKGKVKEVRNYEIEMRNDPELQDTDYYFYTYSIDGRILTEYLNDVGKLCHNQYYWSNDRLDSIVRDGDCYSFEYYIYNADGRLHQVIHGVLSRTDTTTIIYDNRGLPVSTSGDFDSKANKTWFEWYDDGRIKGIGSKYWGKRYEYDDQGRMTTETYNDGHVETYTYNEQGDVSHIKHDPKGNTSYDFGRIAETSYTYTYDNHGNWTEEYHNGTLSVIRKITYYE